MSQKLDLITLHGMVKGVGGNGREPVGRPELAPSRLERKENTMSVTKKTKVLNPSFSEGKKKRRFLSAEKKY